MKVPFYGHVKQYHSIKTEIDARIAEVLESGQYVMGPMLQRFEQELAAYHEMKYAVGVGNGTDALWLTFMALGIGPGDECITTTNTFFATAEAIWIANATAVFVDSDPRTHCIDPTKLEAAITPKTKALVPVHLYGQSADMRAIRDIADRHKLLVIEDNAQGIGSRGDGFRIGELSDAVCTSFIIQKNLGTFGDGGAVITNSEGVDRTVRRLRNHGSEGARNFTLPYETPGYRHVFHLYVIETKKPAQRDPLLDFLNRNGVDAKCHYPIAIHQQEGYPWGKQARIAGPIPNSERNAATCVSLPMFPELTAEEVDYVIEKTMEWDKTA
jgi:dTDP-4-amino-4,6-dideoxygalactose transaminase